MLGKSLKTFWKTKSILSSMEMGAAGWDQKTFDPEAAAGPLVFLYAHDVTTGWTWMGAVEREAFVKASGRASKDSSMVKPARDGAGNVISAVADGAPPKPTAEGLDWEQQLGALLSFYAGTTKTWQAASHFRDGGHFVVLYYRKPGAADGMLRPFAAAGGDTEVMKADDLQALIRRVVAADRMQHPEWFPGASQR